MRIRRFRGLIPSVGAAAAMVLSPAAATADAGVGGSGSNGAGVVFPGTPTPIPCTAMSDGVRYCIGDSSHLIPSWDGTPIDVSVILPAKPKYGPDGPYPLIGFFHGWGLSKFGPSQPGAGRSMDGWAQHGVAAFTMSDRGFGNSCGGGTGQTYTTVQNTQCDQTGYAHVLDERYEVRDAQYLMSLLADQQTSTGNDLIDPRDIGANGASYGGGMSLSLAVLRDRMMMPSGALVPWISPGGQQLRIAAAAPEVPLQDLPDALMPTGHALDYATTANEYGTEFGVMKASFFLNLWEYGLQTAFYEPVAGAPDSDITSFFARAAAGNPYGDPLTTQLLDNLHRYHSAYYLEDSSETPAPVMLSNGFTDDLFPVDEGVRFYNKTVALHPDAFVGLTFLDYGHQRAQARSVDTNRLYARQRDFFDYYLLHQGPPPDPGVWAMPQVCDTAAPAPLYEAPTWAGLQPGEVRSSSDSTQVIANPGSPQEAQSYDPVLQGNACAQAADLGDLPGQVSYRIPVTGHGFTMLGAVTLIADMRVANPGEEIAVRILDVDQGGYPFPEQPQERLVARGLFMPSQSPLSGTQVFQTHPGAWHFASGHTVRVELMPYDPPYSRPSNTEAPIVISRLELRIPTHDAPDGGQVLAPAPRYLPSGYALAAEFRAQRHTKPRKASR